MQFWEVTSRRKSIKLVFFLNWKCGQTYENHILSWYIIYCRYKLVDRGRSLFIVNGWLVLVRNFATWIMHVYALGIISLYFSGTEILEVLRREGRNSNDVGNLIVCMIERWIFRNLHFSAVVDW